MYTITKEFTACCSHVLTGLDEKHPCSRLHGHNYVIKLELSSEQLNEVGFVYDYRKLDTFKAWVDEVMDHHHLNNIFDFNPTAENIAEHIYTMGKSLIPQLVAVEVSETPKTNARYSEKS